MPKDDTWIEIAVTQLAMQARPSGQRMRAPAIGLALQFMRLAHPSVGFYRYLYDTVGAPWRWYERRQLDDADLAALLTDPMVEVAVLYAGGEPAGFAEFRCHDGNEVEIAYFGLMPHFIGRGLGRYFLDAVIDVSWTPRPRMGETQRVWLHTCTLDHPAALRLYQKAGFEPVARSSKRIPDPMRTGDIPPYDGPLPVPNPKGKLIR